jgi:hypothetical protein
MRYENAWRLRPVVYFTECLDKYCLDQPTFRNRYDRSTDDP